MKKAFMLVAAIAMLATPLFAQDEAPTLAGLHGATGSVEFSFGDDEIGADEGFGFTSTADGSLTGTITASIATEKVEAGATISLVPTIELNEDDVEVDITDQMTLHLDTVKDAISWYEGNDDTDYNTLWNNAPDWEAEIGMVAIYDESDPDGPWLIDDADIDTQTEFDNVWAAMDNVFSFIVGEIEAFDDGEGLNLTVAAIKADGDYYIDQYGEMRDGADAVVPTATSPATAAEIAEMDLVNDAANDYLDHFPENADDTYDVSFPVSDAYFRLLAVGGVVDVEFELNGKEVTVGSKFPQTADDANLGIGIALTAGVIEGLSVSALYTNAPAVAAITNDYDTVADDAEDADAAVNALQINAGYATDMFNVNAAMAIEDLADIDLWFSVMGGVSLPDLAGLAANLEFTKMSAGNGMGIAVDVAASILGIAPSVDFRYHIAGDDLTDSYDLGVAEDDTTGDETALAYFNSALAANGYLGIGLVVDFAEIMGMSLITLDGGFNMVFGAGNDWNVGIAFDLTEIVFPVTVSGGFASAYDAVMSWDAGVSTEFAGVTAALAVADDIDDADTALTFDVSLGYTYDVVDLSAAFGINEDSEKSFSITAKTSF